jgi:hypothetical protein
LLSPNRDQLATLAETEPQWHGAQILATIRPRYLSLGAKMIEVRQGRGPLSAVCHNPERIVGQSPLKHESIQRVAGISMRVCRERTTSNGSAELHRR